MTARKSLDVWLYGTRVATITDHGREIQLRWSQEAYDRWGQGARVVSHLLPIDRPSEHPHHTRVRVFLAGLLPEGNIRERYAHEAGVTGIQPKIVLFRTPDGWARCLDGYPSTHIAKLAHPPDSYASDVVHTEVASLDLARGLGLTIVAAELIDFGGQLAIVVSRYDRFTDEEGHVQRIHQEDGAQALGINTDDPIRKFQYSKSLPSLQKLAEVLRAGGSEPDKLLALTTFNLAIGNTDAHAKNISFRNSDGDASLASAYDVAMHLHHKSANRTFAMNVNGKSEIDDITVDDLLAEASHWRMPRRRALLTVAETLHGLSAELTALDRGRYPGVPDVAFRVVQERTLNLIGQLP
jgi:serine/threonine-protein kinase HipA